MDKKTQTTDKSNQQPKQRYMPPQITTYATQHLLGQLGPARAFSGGRSFDPIEAELFGLD